ncbi:MucB/RseB C-terminal domain-containing protein [Marinobacterium sedimentorum]|uniref:MucB/RseB C-terminal domain-containing protein n=1 Tax=Marinobacterium sedimentorum TaxID=2927804 RepID=UPI0020C6B475|nr:MucB/RseB C-terminal domain-containing protein [Marinobacterium sedimentorum]MCP8689938.1 MucB/RseB C-terminal domain-containing protein [Marinobacterium sedimentorum]
MSDQFNDTLSALVDGEANDFETRRLLSTLDEQPAMGEKWRRYHLTRSALKGERDTVMTDISAGVMAQIASADPGSLLDTRDNVVEQEVAPRKVEAGRYWKPLISMATAASVTAAVILGVQGFNAEPVNTVASNQPQYLLPSVSSSADFVRARYGHESGYAAQGATPQADVIRLPRGLERYIDQHQHMLGAKKPGWRAQWLPDGFTKVRHEVMPDAEVMLFSDGRHSVSVCIEPFGRQTVAAGAAQSKDMIAVGKRRGDDFVTVVGDVPLMIADRIAASVQVSQ